MNLLLINYEYPPIGGGAANAAWHLAKALNESGNSATVLTVAYRDLKSWQDENGVMVFRCRGIRKNRSGSTILEMLIFMVFAAAAVLKIARQRKIEGIIVFFLFPCGPIGLLSYLLLRIPYLISLRGGDVVGTEPGLLWLHRLLQPMRKLIYRTCVGIVANSTGLKEIAHQTDRVDIQVIPNGVNTYFFQPSASRHYGNNDVFQLLYAGRFQPEKNLCFLFRELSELVGHTAAPFVLHMVGEGPQKDDLEEIAKKSGFSDRVAWHGWLDRPLKCRRCTGAWTASSCRRATKACPM